MSSLAGVHATAVAWIALQGPHCTCIPDRLTHGQTDRQSDRKAVMWCLLHCVLHRQTDRQTDRQTSRQTVVWLCSVFQYCL